MSANEIISTNEIHEEKNSVTEEILEILKKRQQTIPRNGIVHKMWSKNITKKCKQVKYELLNEKSAEIET